MAIQPKYMSMEINEYANYFIMDIHNNMLIMSLKMQKKFRVLELKVRNHMKL